MKQKKTAKKITLRVYILPDGEFDKQFGKSTWSMWDDVAFAVILRESRTGLLRLSDFLHEMKHVWVDAIDNEQGFMNE